MGGSSGGRAPSITPQTVTAPSGAEMVGVGTGATRGMGNAAAETNVSGRMTQLGGLLSLLTSGGAYALDPQLRAQYDSLMKSVNQATKGPLQKINKLESQIAKLESKSNLTDKDREKLTKFQTQRDSLQSEVTKQNERVTTFENTKLANAPVATDELRQAFPELDAAVAEAAPYLDRMGQLGATGERLMSALGQGFQGRDIRADQVRAATMGDFGAARSRDISAGQVGAGRLGDSLMSEAQRRIALQGQLSPEASRDATQAARQGFAARGMATGNASMAAELLNRDRYSRQRGFEDLAFAQGVQAQDIGRQFQNVGNQLTAAQSNQSAAMQAELANLQARYNSAVQQGNWQMAAQAQNQAANLQASIASEESRRLGTQLNTSMLGQAFTTDRMVNQEGLGAALQRSQLAGAANPNNMLLSMYGSGEPTGSQALGPAASMANTWATNALNANMFNANSQMWTNAANMYQPGGMQASPLSGALGGALGGAALGFQMGGPWGAAGGAVLGGAAGLGAGYIR